MSKRNKHGGGATPKGSKQTFSERRQVSEKQRRVTLSPVPVKDKTQPTINASFAKVTKGDPRIGQVKDTSRTSPGRTYTDALINGKNTTTGQPTNDNANASKKGKANNAVATKVRHNNKTKAIQHDTGKNVTTKSAKTTIAETKVNLPSKEQAANDTYKEKIKALQFPFLMDILGEDKQTGVEAIQKVHEMIEFLLGESSQAFLSAKDEKFVQALCLMTSTPIDYKKMIFDEDLKCVFEDALSIIQNPEVSDSQIANWLYGAELLRQMSNARGAVNFGTLVTGIRDGKVKAISNIGNWNVFATAVGCFLPPNSMDPAYKSGLVKTALAKLKQMSFSQLRMDPFSFAVIGNHTGAQLAENCSLPGILLEKGLDVVVRREACESYCGLVIPPECMVGKDYGTTAWCAAGKDCKIDLGCAKSMCNDCQLPCHLDCGTPLKGKVW